MNAHTLRVLEFEAIRERLAEQCQCRMGIELALSLAPSADPEEVARLQEETAEAVELLTIPPHPTLGGVHDLRAEVKRALAGGVLDAPTLLQVGDTLRGARKLRAVLQTRQAGAPRLAALAEAIGLFPEVERAIEEAIDDRAEVRDDATGALNGIRREGRRLRVRMQEQLQALLRNPAYRDMIRDPVVTTRDGRYCIPIKAEYRSQFAGLVHDLSSSGHTLFMEPQAVVELGSLLRENEVREREEVRRILAEITGKLGRRGEEAAETLALLGELDLILARGRLSLAMGAVEPVLDDEGFLFLRQARHPLLIGEVVPLDIELGRDFTTLLITGPNTGGKTVALKTAGLLCLMAQCGIHLPCAGSTRVPVFSGIYADIGDEQSLEQSLSTFSGHVRNIVQILEESRKAGGLCLVLLDELGAGTDPSEGAALAQALLDHLRESGARVIGTTHYGQLKEYAAATPGVENASVEFDVATLRPTYRLLIGVPGSSNALSVAGRLGLPDRVLERAGELLKGSETDLAAAVRELTENRVAAERERHRAGAAARREEALRKQREEELAKLRAERTEVLRRARNEAEELLRAARREAEVLRDELRRIERQARREGAAEEGRPAPVPALRERLKQATGRLETRTAKIVRRARHLAPDTTATAPYEELPGPPEAGDTVWVNTLGQRGELLGIDARGRARVQVGALRTEAPLDDLRKIRPLSPAPARPSPVSTAPSGSSVLARAAISPELHLLGRRAEEALTALEGYVDQACLAGLSPFRVIHGRGSGALRKVVWAYLERHPNVAAFRHAEQEDGGAGVTVVELRG